LSVEIVPFVRLPGWARTEIEAETERLAKFLDRAHHDRTWVE
jgi:hypothetical protein